MKERRARSGNLGSAGGLIGQGKIKEKDLHYEVVQLLRLEKVDIAPR